MGRHAADLIGREFGRLRPEENLGKDRWGNYLWRCRCTCADRTVLVCRAVDLFRKKKTSCGCLSAEQRARSRSPLRIQVEALRAEGKTFSEIAKIVGISRQRAHKMFKESVNGEA